jgi:hypothetical protein
MHGIALVFMVLFWGLVLGLVVFVFCKLYSSEYIDKIEKEKCYPPNQNYGRS